MNAFNSKKSEDKVECHTPTPGKASTRIDRWKYDCLREKILEVLPTQGEGVLFQELPELVASRLSSDEKKRLGSISWYVTTVKLDLEVQGEIFRVSGVSPQRLLRK